MACPPPARPVLRRKAAGGGGRGLVLAVLLILPPAAAAEIVLPPGFTARVYVTGAGFSSGAGRGEPGVPAISTMAVDADGILYLARTGRRYLGGDADDLTPIYRIPVGGARLTVDTEPTLLHGPPLASPQVAAGRVGHDLWLTTFDRDRRLGVLYRMRDGRVQLVAGGTPVGGGPPLLRQPEGVAVDSAGQVYVADRQQGAVIRLDPSGRLLDAAHVRVTRPRVLAIDEADQLWIAADGPAEAPWQQGPGEIWRVPRGAEPILVLRGPMTAGFALSPGGNLFVAERQATRVFILTPKGERLEFARFTDGDAPRGLVFAPVAPGTRRGHLAGDLFVVTIRRGAWPVNEILRVSGPFDELVRERAAGTP